MLNTIYDHIKINNVTLYSYLDHHCNHLLESPVGDTGIDKEQVTNKLTEEAVKLTTDYSTKLVGELKNSCGCYILFNDTQDSTYVGSNIKFGLRLDQHYHEIGSSNRKLYTEIVIQGVDKFNWKAVYVGQNYYNDFIINNTEFTADPVVKRVLTDFIKYENRLVEQSIMNYVQPYLNGSQIVTFPVNWDSDSITNVVTVNKRPITAVIESGSTIHFDSINSASDITGIHRKSIIEAINTKSTVKSAKLDTKVTFTDSTSIEDNMLNKVVVSEPMKVDVASLPLNKVVVFDNNWKEVGSYNTATEAAEAYSINTSSVIPYVNKRFVLITVNGVLTALYFARNTAQSYKGISNPVVCHDTIDNTAIEYKSIGDCTRTLGLATQRSRWTDMYVKGDKLYKNKYRISYLHEYKGPTPKKDNNN